MLRKYLIYLIGGFIATSITLLATNVVVYVGAANSAHAQSQPYKWDRMKWIGAWHSNTYATQVWCDLKLHKEIYASRDGIITITEISCK